MIRANLKILLAAVETTYGQAAATNPATDALLVENLSLTPLEGEQAAPEVVRPTFGAPEALPLSGRRAQISFDVPLAGAGSAGGVPRWGRLLRGCAMNETITPGVRVDYQPTSGAMDSLTLEIYRDGVLHRITGARGAFTFSVQAGDAPRLRFEFTGLYQPITAAAMPAGASIPATPKPLPADPAHTTQTALLGHAVAAKSLEIKGGQDVQHRLMVNAERVDITGRKPEGQIVFEEPSPGTWDIWADAANAATGALAFTHGTAAGNIVELACPRVQLGKPTLSDEAGISFVQVPITPLSTAPTAEDDIRISVR